jgi:hypothetical protein
MGAARAATRGACVLFEDLDSFSLGSFADQDRDALSSELRSGSDLLLGLGIEKD